MFDHVGIQAADVPGSVEFYLTAFAPLGLREAARFEVEDALIVGLSGAQGEPAFWLSPAMRPDDREAHIAFSAPSRRAVDAVHTAALGAGYEVLHAPRVWTEYHENYYAVFLRDPDGHNIEAVFHGPPEA